MAATQFEIDNALMAGRAYFDTRASTNRFPVPQGWAEFKHRALDSGFEAMSFQLESNPNEIVISFAGTGPGGLVPGTPGFVDWIANSDLALGSMSSQLVPAALYYLEVKSANLGATISFTGHSLGGGLAALMAVFFDEQAVTFDQAPFENSSASIIRDELEFFLNGYGYSDADLTALVPEFMAYGGKGTRTANVTGYYVEGEALHVYPPATLFSTIGTQPMLPQNSVDVNAVKLHSQTLLTAFLLNNTFRDLTYKLPSLLNTLFDESLYARDTEPGPNAQRNFLDNLLRHQIGVAADPVAGIAAIPADAMLDRFVIDLQKLIPDTYGMASGTDMAKALTVAAMEYAYFKDAAVATQLFTFDNFGLHFKYSDIGASSYKSLPKLAEAVNAFLSPAEQALLNGKLVKQDAWHIQSGVGGMIVNGGAGNDAMIGGANADGLWGSGGNDILIGGVNNDVLVGETGNDFLLGGQGFDTYIINSGDGYDTVLDTDGQGVIQFGAVAAKGSTGIDPKKWIHTEGSDTWVDQQNGITYSKSLVAGETRLLVKKGDSSVLVKGWSENELGIALGASTPPPPANKTYTGSASSDLMMNWDLAGWGWSGSPNMATPGALNRYDGQGGADFIQTDFVDDAVDGGIGNDYILAQYGGSDIVNGGIGNDYIHIGDPDPANDGGASSLRQIPANNRAFVDGGDGNDTITVTRQYAPMAIALDGAIAGSAYSLAEVAGGDFSTKWAAAYSGWQRAASTFYTFPGTPAFTFTGWQRDGVSLAKSTDGRLNLYATFQQSTPEFSTAFGPYGQIRFVPVFIYQPSQNNDDTTGHTLFGGAGNDMVEGGLGDDFIDGGADNDTLDGEGGADTIFGGSGDDLILGGEGNDWIDGGQGADEMYGEQGNDTYVFAKGAGVDRITDYDTTVGNFDVVQFLDVASGEITSLERSGNSLIFKYGAGDQLGVVSYFSAGYKVEQFEFSDGVIWDEAAIVASTADNDTIYGSAGDDVFDGGSCDDILSGGGGNDTLSGGTGNDYLNGDSGNDILDGGSGNDVLSGGVGADTYLFGKGTGQDIVSEYGGDAAGTNPDTIQLGAGITVDDVALTRSGDDLYIYINGTDDCLRLLKYFSLDGVSTDTVENIKFVGGPTWDVDTVKSMMLISSVGNDDLRGYATNDTISGGDGNDTIYGMAGIDVLDGGTGRDRLLGGLGDDTLMGGAGDDELCGEDGNDILNGGAGYDQLYGGAGNDTLNGGADGGTLVGGAGSDTYLFGMGSGGCIVSNFAGHTLGIDPDTILLGAGIAVTDVTLTRDNDNLILAINGTSDKLYVDRYFQQDGASNWVVENIQFTDGPTWDYATTKSKASTVLPPTNITVYGGAGNDTLTGGLGDDTIYGYGGDDRLDGGAGNDTLNGGAGNDTYLFGHGSGNDAISDYDETQGKLDAIELGEGIAEADVTLTRLGTDSLLLSIIGSTDSLQINGYFNNNPAVGFHIGKIKFAGGPIWDAGMIKTKTQVLASTEGDDELYGYATTNTLSGMGGDDSIFGGDGGDTLDGGSDEDYVRGGYGNDTIRGGAGADALWDAGGLNTLQGQEGNDTLHGGKDIDTLEGGAGNDSLYGGEGDDVLDGGADDDVLDGGTGNDIYLFGRGSGKDTINGNSYFDYSWGTTYRIAGGFDVIQMGTDVLASDVRLKRDGDTLVLFITGTADRLWISDYFKGDTTYGYTIEQIKFTGGPTWDVKMINAKVLVATAGNDTLSGYAGNDILEGGDGNDRLSGQAGDDVLVGGGDNDTLDGGVGNDYLSGGQGRDSLTGGAGNDTLDGGQGADTMIGGAGDDIYYIDNAGDIVTEATNEGVDMVYVGNSQPYILAANVENGERSFAGSLTGNALNNILTGSYGNDTLDGGAGADTLTGGYGTDNLIGGSGTDRLDGGTGSDTMIGGAGDDTYVVDELGDIVTEAADGGIDAVQSTITYTLGANVENLTLTGAEAIDGTGNELGNVLCGNSGMNTLLGLGGNDTIYAGDGDTADGGDGNDTLIGDNTMGWSYLWGQAGDDVLVGGSTSGFFSGGLGNDTITGGTGMNFIWGDDQIATGLGGNDTITGGDQYDFVIAGAGDDVVYGLAGDDNLSGNQGNDSLYGGAGNDYMFGGSGTDRLDGGSGSDTMIGGTGDDSYVVGNIGDVITELVGEGNDSVELVIAADYTLVANLETAYRSYGTGSWTTTGNADNNILSGNEGDDTLIGLGGDDLLWGGAGADTLIGGAGNDSYYVNQATDVVTEMADEGVDKVYVFSTMAYTLTDNVENGARTFWGGSLTGNTLNNTLEGSWSDDMLDGGAGADTLSGWGGDDNYVVDNIGDIVNEDGDSGTDSIQSSITYMLGTNVENLTLTGTEAINGTGNELGNVLRGNSAINTLSGLDGDDTIYVGDSDTAMGGNGNDTLIAENTGGWTYMYGEGGDDLLTGGSNSGYFEGGEGNDVIRGGAGFNFIYGDVQGAAGGGNDTIYGGDGSDFIMAQGGDDVVYGNDGGDSLGGGFGNDALYGDAGDDYLNGQAGNDLLDGGTGTDTLYGGAGDDTYTLGRGYGIDTVIENDATAGNTDVAQFLSDISVDQIWFQHVGNNLEASIIGTSDKLVIQDWYSGSASHVEQFKTVGGQTLLDSQVENLVSAMASFAPPAAGQTTLPTNYQSSLTPVIAANWQ